MKDSVPTELKRIFARMGRAEGKGRMSGLGASCLFLLLLLALPESARTGELAPSGDCYEVRVVSGSLEKVLNDFAGQTRISLVWLPERVVGRYSQGLTGCWEIGAGLGELLRGHPLKAVQNPDGGYRILDASAEAGNRPLVLQKMVVTGEKVEKPVHDTGASVQIYDTRRIEAAVRAADVSDLLKMTPNIVDVGNGNDLPTVRGIDGSGPGRGAVAFLTGTRPRLNVSLDGRSLTYNELAFGPQSLWDVERVEVFLGPQSYLQGRNAIAGAVVLSSMDPAFTWEGAVKGAAAEQAYSQMAVMVSGPVIKDRLAFRISADRQKRESFVDLESYAPAGNPREVETTTARARLLYLPPGIPALLSRLSLTHFDTRAPQSEALVPPPETGSKFSAARPVFETRSTSGIWDVEWGLSEGLIFENKMIYTAFDNDRLTAPGDACADVDGREFQMEPLMRFGRKEDIVRGLAGLRYFRTQQDEFVNIFGGSDFDDRTETASVYGEITYALTSRIDLTLGGRFEQEHRERKGGSAGVRQGGKTYTVHVDFDETYAAFLPKLDVAWKIHGDHTLGAKIARGYRAGGAGITFDLPWTSFAFAEEYVWNYEIYSRHRLRGGRLELTSNLFFNDHEDMQLPYYINASAVTIINADKVRSYGAEMGFRWLPASCLEFFGGAGLLRTEIIRFAQTRYEGNALPRAPDFSANLGAVYRFAPRIELSGGLTFRDDYHSYYDNDPRGRIAAYWTADLQLVCHLLDGGRVSLFARNILDEDHAVMISDNAVEAPVTERPRMVGVSLEWNF